MGQGLSSQDMPMNTHGSSAADTHFPDQIEDWDGERQREAEVERHHGVSRVQEDGEGQEEEVRPKLQRALLLSPFV
eukprot:scaffold88500_cov17-Tisochrysis_lutea.AAC.1